MLSCITHSSDFFSAACNIARHFFQSTFVDVVLSIDASLSLVPRLCVPNTISSGTKGAGRGNEKSINHPDSIGLRGGYRCKLPRYGLRRLDDGERNRDVRYTRDEFPRVRSARPSHCKTRKRYTTESAFVSISSVSKLLCL